MRTTTTTTTITDDLDGSAEAHTMTFAVDGRAYEIDLSDTNKKQLLELLRPYTNAGRPIKAPASRPPRKRAAPGPRRPATDDTATAGGADMRQWWKDHPTDLPTWQARGAIPVAVIRAYNASR